MIKQSSIEQLKEMASISQVVGAYLSLDKHGKACCPFHDEKSPSFSVTEKKGIYKCFGCGEGGDVFQFVIKHDNIAFVAAVEQVAKITGFALEYEEVTEEIKKAQSELQQMFDFNLWLANVYSSCLLTSKSANEYLDKRGYTLEEAIKLELGYAPDSYDFIKNKCVDNGYLPIALKLGVIKQGEKGNMYDFWRDRLMFPIKDKKGKVVGFTGRYVGTDAITIKERKYMNSKSSAVFNKEISLFGIERAADAIRKQESAYIVEGSFDVTSAHLINMLNVVATCGTTLGRGHLQSLKILGAKVIYLLRDNDSAGEKATLKDIDTVAEAGLIPFVCQLTDANDLDEKIQLNKKKTN